MAMATARYANKNKLPLQKFVIYLYLVRIVAASIAKGLGNAIWNVLMCAVSSKYIFGKIFNICVLSVCGISIPDVYALGLLPNWVCVCVCLVCHIHSLVR